MNPLQTNMLNALVGAAIALAAVATTVPARADAFAQSILVVDNLRLRHGNGRPYTARELTIWSAGNASYAAGGLNGEFANVLQPGVADIAQQGVGALPAREENAFTPLLSGEGDFGSADQRMAGTLITNGAKRAGASIESRADASLKSAGFAMGNSGMAGATTFTFELGFDEFMTISFDALAFTQAAVAEARDMSTAATAQLAWSISVLDLTTGATVFSFQPQQLNAMSNVSRTSGLTGATTYDPGWQSFSATTGLLAGGDTYQVTIAQSTFATAIQSQQMPEPGTLSGIGAGLLAMAALSRRRRR